MELQFFEEVGECFVVKLSTLTDNALYRTVGVLKHKT